MIQYVLIQFRNHSSIELITNEELIEPIEQLNLGYNQDPSYELDIPILVGEIISRFHKKLVYIYL